MHFQMFESMDEVLRLALEGPLAVPGANRKEYSQASTEPPAGSDSTAH